MVLRTFPTTMELIFVGPLLITIDIDMIHIDRDPLSRVVVDQMIKIIQISLFKCVNSKAKTTNIYFSTETYPFLVL